MFFCPKKIWHLRCLGGCVRHVNCWLWSRCPVSCHGRTIVTFPHARQCILLLKFLWKSTFYIRPEHCRAYWPLDVAQSILPCNADHTCNCIAVLRSNYIAAHRENRQELATPLTQCRLNTTNYVWSDIRYKIVATEYKIHKISLEMAKTVNLIRQIRNILESV